jgi:hypothetical protein
MNAKRAIALAFLSVLASCGSRVTAFAQDPAPDPLNADTFKAVFAWKGWLATTGSTREDYFGGMAVAQVGLGHLGIAVRGVVAGLPGEFSQDDPTTFRSIEGAAAVHLNTWGSKGLVLGPAMFAGKSVAFDTGGRTVTTPGPFTAAIGLRVAGYGGAAYAGLGTHESLGGVCALGSAQFPLTSHLTVIVDGAVGTSGRAFVRLAIAVEVAE